jgi:hypothetical protein
MPWWLKTPLGVGAAIAFSAFFPMPGWIRLIIPFLALLVVLPRWIMPGWIRFPLMVALLGVSVYGFFTTPLGFLILETIRFKQTLAMLKSGWCVVSCHITHSTDIVAWQTYGDLGRYCREVVCKAVPQAEKIGTYEAIVVKFGTAPHYELPRMYKNETHLFRYTTALTLENPNEEIVIENVVVSGEIYDLEYRKDVGNLFDGYVGRLTARDVMVVGLDTREHLPCEGEHMLITVALSFSYNGSGDNTFFLVRSERDKWYVPRIIPTTSPGPLDIVVSFIPEKYVMGGPFGSMWLYISVRNKMSGEAVIESITIRKADEEYLAVKECRTPWGTHTEGEELKLFEEPLKPLVGVTPAIAEEEEQVYVCEYEITLTELEGPYKSIPFKVEVSYHYTQEIKRDVFASVID